LVITTLSVECRCTGFTIGALARAVERLGDFPDFLAQFVELSGGGCLTLGVLRGDAFHDPRRQRRGVHAEQADARDHERDRAEARVHDDPAADGVPDRALHRLDHHCQAHQPSSRPGSVR
jgi:hypothetical protein